MLIKYHDAKKLYIDLMVDEALDISEKYNWNSNILRKELIEDISNYLEKSRYHPGILKNNMRITIRYYNKNNEHHLIETDTARGKESILVFENDKKNIFVFIIDNDGKIQREL